MTSQQSLKESGFEASRNKKQKMQYIAENKIQREVADKLSKLEVPILLRLPRRFFIDHLERDLPTPDAIKENAFSVYVWSTDPNLPELIDDAIYYWSEGDFDGWADDAKIICRAAGRLLKSFEKQVASK